MGLRLYPLSKGTIMKKQKLFVLTLAAMMSCGVVACGGNGGNGGDTESSFNYGDVEATKIAFARNTVYELEVGETIDLAEYVIMTPVDAKWNVVPLEGQSDCVKIEGTKITGLAAGEFKVRVQAGSNGLVKNYIGTVTSKLLKKTRQMVDAMENDMNYTVALTNPKQKDEIYAVAYHSKNYFAYAETDGIVGLLRSGKGHTLEFSYTGADLDIDLDNYLPKGGTLEVATGFQPDLSLYTMTMPMGLDGSEFADTDEGDIEVTKSAISTILNVGVGVDFTALQQEFGTINAGYLTFPEDGDDALIQLYSGTKPVVNLWIGNIGSTVIDPIDNYIKSKEEPVAPTFPEFDEFLNEANHCKNMTIDGKVSVGYTGANGAWVETNNKTVLSAMEENWGTIPGSYTSKIDGDQSWSIDNDSKGVQMYGMDDGSLVAIDGVLNGGAYEYSKQTVSGFSTIWDEGLSINNDGIVSPAGFTPVDLADEELASIAWSAVEEKNGVINAISSPYGDYGFFMSDSIALIPQVGYFYANLFSGLYSPDFDQIVWYDFMNETEVSYDKAAKKLTIANSLDSMAQSGSQYYGVRFEVSIYNVGTTSGVSESVTEALAAIAAAAEAPEE